MSFQGFGKYQSIKTNKLIKNAVDYCRKQNPEKLDKIFDNLSIEINRKILKGILTDLHDDTDNLAWFCGYLAGEVNRTSDNNKPRHPITLLSKILMKHGMQEFKDFSPYPGCRIIIGNTEKFEALPEKVQMLVQDSFKLIERSTEEAKQINDALLKEITG